MLNFIKLSFIQNFPYVQIIQRAHRIYQFKVEQPAYYPDRQTEMQRLNTQVKSQLVTEEHEKKKLPKDYYYKLLGVNKLATTQQIKTSYYALAKRFHPDSGYITQPMEAKRFQEISNAYHILTDDAKRLEYDQLGMIKDEQNFLRRVSNQQVVASKKVDVPIPTSKDELLQMTNGEPRLELSFLEAAHGMKKVVDLRFLKKCPACNGKSPKLVSRSNSELCRKCNGTGQLTKKTQTYTSVLPCDHCQGKRYINRNQCDMCDNRGLVLETVKVAVPVPSGVKAGDMVAIENPKTKQRVNYRIHVNESDYYQRDGKDLHSDKYLNISEAVLGGVFKVRGIYEDMEIKVEPGTESHTKVTMKGKGIKTREGTGDHIITLKVRIPRTLTMKQRQLILALSKTEEPTFEYSA